MTRTQTTPQTASPLPDQPLTAGVVRDMPNLILRAEGVALLAVATLAYAWTGSGWAMFALLFLVPDVFMLGYLHGPRVGAMIYNLGHCTILPFALAGFGLLASTPLAVSVGLIWLAHVGFDRAVGYGLKYTGHFKHTHLGTPFAGKD